MSCLLELCLAFSPQIHFEMYELFGVCKPLLYFYCSYFLSHCDLGHVVITVLTSLLLMSSLCVVVFVSFHVMMVYFVA